MVRPVLLASALLALAACSKPTAPDKKHPPEPQAAAAAGGLAQAMHDPLQRTRDAQAALAATQARQDRALAATSAGASTGDAGPGGDASP